MVAAAREMVETHFSPSSLFARGLGYMPFFTARDSDNYKGFWRRNSPLSRFKSEKVWLFFHTNVNFLLSTPRHFEHHDACIF